MFEMSKADLDIDYLASARHFHLSSLFLHRALQAGLPELFRELKSRGLTISLDTNDDPQDAWRSPLQELLPLVDVLLPNKYELCRIAHRDSVDEALGELAALVPVIAVKCGQDGAIVQNHGKRTRVAGLTVDSIDTIGAGDSFNAGFLAAWLSGCSPEESAVAGKHHRSILNPTSRRNRGLSLPTGTRIISAEAPLSSHPGQAGIEQDMIRFAFLALLWLSHAIQTGRELNHV